MQFYIARFLKIQQRFTIFTALNNINFTTNAVLNIIKFTIV